MPHEFLVDANKKEYEIAKSKYYDQIYDRALSFIILPTEQCNFNCRYCYETHQHGKMNDELIKNMLLFLKTNLSSYSKLTIEWFGGEPLLAIDIIEYLSKEISGLCKLCHVPYSASMTTNGYLLTDKMMKKLLQLNIRNFQITIDGAKEIHDKYRVLKNGGATYDTIISNLKGIRDSIRQSFLILIRVNVTTSSFESLAEFIDLMEREFGYDQRFIMQIHPVGEWGENEDGEFVEEMIDTQEIIYDFLLENEKASRFTVEAYRKLLQSGVCYAAKRNNYVIGADGKIYKCTVNLYNEQNQIGKFQSPGKMCIDENKLVSWIIQSNDENNCVQCAFQQYCHGGYCPAVKLKKQSSCKFAEESLKKILLLIYKGKYNKSFIEYEEL